MDSQKTIHITHLFSSFVTKPGTVVDTEVKLVQESWRRAQKHAFKLGINVEFVDVLLEEDLASVPQDFARHGFLHDTLEDVFKGRIATVGEVFRWAHRWAGEVGICWEAFLACNFARRGLPTSAQPFVYQIQ